MLTRCPDCATRFRARPEHLQAAAGRVRCGRCGRVFDARVHAAALSPPLLPAPITVTASPRWRSNALWGIGLLLLTVALALQWVWWERFRLAADPQLQQIVLPWCRYLPCGLEPPRAPERIEVLERALEPDTQRPDLLHFRLRMVSRAPQAQPFPLLELRLLDAQAQVTGLRRFTPRQYRPAGAPESALMPPGEPQQAHLELLDPHARMSGFQIDFR